MFKNRVDAAQQLALALDEYKDRNDVIILALPRGGVVLGYEVSRSLHIPLDVILVRKLGVPGQEELAMGAISLNGIKTMNESVTRMLNIPKEAIDAVIAREEQELIRRNKVYRHNRPMPSLEGKIVILIDDGIATGATMRAAIKIVATLSPKKIIVAVPLASSSVYEEFNDQPVELKVLKTPEPFFGIGMWYHEFQQVTDEEVISLLQRGWHA